MSRKVEIYTKALCPYSHRAKDLLRIKGVNYTEYDITDDQVRATEMYHRCQHRTVPKVFIDGHFVGGCSDLFELDEQGHLDHLLSMIIK